MRRFKKSHLFSKLQNALEKDSIIRRRLLESYDWEMQARPSQRIPKGNWHIWLLMAGRGFGKTRTGAETLRKWVREGIYKRIALIGETDRDVRQVMVEGRSGLLKVHPPSERPNYESSKGQLIWPNGAIATCFSSFCYDRLRGPQFDAAWIDELAKFKEGEKVWDQLMLSLRLGANPRAIVTTTPRPLPLIKKLLKDKDVFVTRGSTFENVKNLAAHFVRSIKRKYEKTAFGRQELYAEVIDECEGALWTPKLLERARRSYKEMELLRLVIAIDPAVSHGAKSDETGIILAGVTAEGIGVVLDDFSLKGKPHEWIQKAIEVYHRFHADRIVAEVNMGGDLVEQLLRTYDKSISFKSVRAVRGKITRAEPIAALYEQGRVWHADRFNKLEEQLTTYVPGKSKGSPDRLDALVWALTELMFTPRLEPKGWMG